MKQSILIENFTTESGFLQSSIPLNYRVFGAPLHSAPIICVNHALTGNSKVSGDDGWWRELIGAGKTIDTKCFSVIAFDIPGNGDDGFLIENYTDFIAKDMARLFLMGLERLKIFRLKALLGGSLGGGLAWEMAVLSPKLSEHVIVIATDYQSSDWLIANCHLQEQILLNSSQPINDARIHAMLCYRTPNSFKQRFNRAKQTDEKVYQVESWLNYHGKTLEKRFQLYAYLLMNQLLRTIDIRFEEEPFLVTQIEARIHILAIDSDLFFPATESRLKHQMLAQKHDAVCYHEIVSGHGHDAFLIEYEQLAKILMPIFNKHESKSNISVIKFGGRSLANAMDGLRRTVQIIKNHLVKNNKLVVVVSARGNTTARLNGLLEQACNGGEWAEDLNDLINYQQPLNINNNSPLNSPEVDFSVETTLLNKRLKGVALIGDYSAKTRDEILAQGELMAVKTLKHQLQKYGLESVVFDTTKYLITDSNFGQAQPLDRFDSENLQSLVADCENETVIIAAGFVGINHANEITTLGINGSNFTAAFLANHLNADKVFNYTHVDGLYTANPDWVKGAQKIKNLSFSEANELASLGTEVLHAKTMIPLIQKNIPLMLLNTFNPSATGTLINAESAHCGLKCVTSDDQVALINFEGRGLQGHIGVDARIFSTLARNNINVNMISQSSAERGVGLVVHQSQAKLAQQLLLIEFKEDIRIDDVSAIDLIIEVVVVTAIGLSLDALDKPLKTLVRNRIRPYIITNSLNGKNVSVVVKSEHEVKAVRVIHEAIFGAIKNVHLLVFGRGVVGSTFIKQVIKAQPQLLAEQHINLSIVAVLNSTHMIFNADGLKGDWSKESADFKQENDLNCLIQLVLENDLENVIAVDNTASADMAAKYQQIIRSGFDLVSSNKIANTMDLVYYHELRDLLSTEHRKYLYETNVGAGLPIIETIKNLHHSGENIMSIRGIFSGSISYILNRFGDEKISFSQAVIAAKNAGYTEPDPRHDLNGQDVARKLVILAREIGLGVEISDVQIDSLVPTDLEHVASDEFMHNIGDLDADFESLKSNLKSGRVLRYVGEITGDLMNAEGLILKVSLHAVPLSSPMGRVKGSDSLFEIFTASYSDNPIVIQGAGAGAEVTARGVLSDVLKIVNNGAS